MAGGEGRSCSRNSFVVDGFPDGCGGSGGGQELAKAGRAEALGGSCGEYDALEMGQADARERSEENTSELQSLMRISYAVFCLQKQIKYICYTVHRKQKKK